MKKSLTIEDLKNRVGKPIFVVCTFYREWRVLKNIGFGGVNTIEFTDKSWIAKEYQDKFRFFDTEVTATELAEILDAEEKEKKKTGYERVREGEKYWNTRGDSFLDDDNFLNVLYFRGDYINNENLAKNIARAEQLKNQLRRYASLNGGIPSQADWKNSHVAKYEIIGESDNFIHATKNFESRAIGAVYFKDIKACEEAIEIFKDELIWCFTEFEEMLY